MYSGELKTGSVASDYARKPDVAEWRTLLHSGDGGRWRAIRQALDSIDAPTTADELGVSDDEVLEALTTAHEIRDRYTILGNGVDLDAAVETATATGVIDRE